MKKTMIVISILLSPLIFLVFMVICDGKFKYAAEREAESEYWDQYYYSVSNVGSTTMPTLAEQGYVLYQGLPEPFLRLKESEDFSEDFILTDRDEGGSELLDMIESPEDLASPGFKYTGGAITVSELQEIRYRGKLVYNVKDNRFADREKMQKLEDSGFTGVMEQIEKIEACEKERRATQGDKGQREGIDAYDHTYKFYLQGVSFCVTPVYEENAVYDVDIILNLSSLYMPEKYKDFIESQTAGGGYFLYASCLGGKRETVTLCKSNTLCIYEANFGKEIPQADNKRISYVFEDGKLVDCFMTVTDGGSRELDETDQKLIGTAQKALGKKLSEQPAMQSSFTLERVYRMEA